jgi:hypothetical protein
MIGFRVPFSKPLITKSTTVFWRLREFALEFAPSSHHKVAPKNLTPALMRGSGECLVFTA